MADPNGYQSTADSAGPGDQQTASSSRRGLTVGRFVNILTLALHFSTFISTSCIIGAVGKLLNDFQTGFQNTTEPRNHCPFWANVDVTRSQSSITYSLLLSGDGAPCVWYMIGGAILGVSAIVFGIVSIVRIIFAMDVGLVGILVELVATGLLLPLSIGLAVSITIGLAYICDEVQDYAAYDNFYGSCADLLGCTAVYIGGSTTGPPKVCWYGAAQVVQDAGWAVALIMLVSMVISVVKLIVWRVRRNHVRRLRAQLGYDKLVQENSEHSPFKE